MSGFLLPINEDGEEDMETDESSLSGKLFALCISRGLSWYKNKELGEEDLRYNDKP